MHFQTNLECFYKDIYSSNNILRRAPKPYLSETNVLAYFARRSVTKTESFFSFSLMHFQSNLECFTLTFILVIT